MSADPIQSVLFDFENIIWLTILIGLLLAAGWQRLASRRQEEVPVPVLEIGIAADSETGLERDSSEGQGRLQAGVPVAQFTGFDLVFLPLILIKYSYSMQFMISRLMNQAGTGEGGSGSAAATTAASSEQVAMFMIADMTINIFLIILVILMIQWVGKRDLDSVLGLSRLSWLRRLLWILGGAVICTPIIMVTSNSMPDWLEGIFGERIEEQAAVQSMRAASDWGLRVLLIVNACLIAPVVEELVFRGFFYGVMKRFTGAMFAAFVSAALFSVAHQNIQALLPLWGFALLLTLFYESTRCIWVPIGIHAVFNMINVTLILLGVGGDAAPPAGGEG